MSVAPASRLTGHAAALAETHLLRGLPEDQLLELAPLFFRRELPAGVTLFREGDPGRSMLILHSGAVEVARRLPGRELALAAVGATEALGEMALVSGQPRSATVRTTLPTVAYELEAGTFARLRSDGRPVAVELIRRIGEGAVRRLRERTVGIARSLEEQVGMGPPRLGPSQPARLHAAANPETDADYLAGILFFQGLTPAAVAEHVVTAVTEDRFWILPSREWLDLAAARWDSIHAGENPSRPEQMPGLPPTSQLFAEMIDAVLRESPE